MKLVLSNGRTVQYGRRARRITVAVIAVTAMLGASASSCDSSPSTGAQQQSQSQTEQAFKQQSTAVPYPASQLTDSLERRNLREKLLRYNNPSKISYLYLLSQAGGVYAYFTIKGKVSSNQSQMTTSNLIETTCNSSACDHPVVAAPGDDGSYGANEDGEFAFTTDGVMVTWNGPYILTDAPMKLSQATVPLSYVDGSRPSSTGGK